MKHQNLNELAARLSVLEHAIELVLANQLAVQLPQVSEKFKADFIQATSDPKLPDVSTDEQLEAELAFYLKKCGSEMIERVSNLEALIRVERGIAVLKQKAPGCNAEG